MRTVTVVLALAFVSCPFGRASAAGFSDSICPEATQYVLGVGKLSKDDPPQRVYDAAQAAVDAYALCSKDKLSHGFREAQHYADTRGAGLAVVAARALIALNRLDDAQRELQQYRPLVQQVVDWQSETQTSSNAHFHRAAEDAPTGPGGGNDVQTTGSDHRPSMYRASAKDIVAAIDAELAQIALRSRDVAHPQAQTSPPHR